MGGKRKISGSDKVKKRRLLTRSPVRKLKLVMTITMARARKKAISKVIRPATPLLTNKNVPTSP